MKDEELHDEFLDGDGLDEISSIASRRTVNEEFLTHCGGQSTPRTTQPGNLATRFWTDHLSRDDEFDLIRRAKAWDFDAKEQLVRAYQKLVRGIAGDYYGPRVWRACSCRLARFLGRFR